MTLRNLLLAVDDGALFETMVPAAVQMAHALGVEDMTFAAGARVPPPSPVGAMGRGLGRLNSRQSEALHRLAALSERSRAAAKGLRSTWNAEAVEDPTRFLLSQVDRSDLVVVPQAGLHGPEFGRIDVARLILGAGRPVLVAPRDQTKLVLNRILVAWNDTREARWAVAAAVPLMRQAERVLIVGVGADSRSERLEQVAAFCGAHGVYALIDAQTDVPSGYEGQALMDAADRDGSNLIVSGAYGRSRLRELVLGGVTRDLLLRARQPCLFAH